MRDKLLHYAISNHSYGLAWVMINLFRTPLTHAHFQCSQHFLSLYTFFKRANPALEKSYQASLAKVSLSSPANVVIPTATLAKPILFLQKASIEQALSGDPDRIPFERMIDNAHSAITLGSPDIFGACEYTFNDIPLKSTPLNLGLRRLIFSYLISNPAQRIRLIEVIVSLIKHGADVFQTYNYSKSSINHNLLESDIKPAICYLINSSHSLEFIEAVSAVTLNQKPDLVYQQLPELVFRRYDAAPSEQPYRSIITCLHLMQKLSFDEITPTLKTFLFSVLLENIKQGYHHDAQYQMYLTTILDLLMVRLPETDITKNIFRRCLQKNDIKDWVINFPESVNWKTLGDALESGKLASQVSNKLTQTLLQHGLMKNIYRLKRFDVAGLVTTDTWQGQSEAMIRANPSGIYSTVRPAIKAISQGQSDILMITVRQLCEENQLTFHALLGRTILLKDTIGNIFALKVQKKQEPITELEKEYRSVRYLHSEKQRVKLQSAMPIAITVNKTKKAELLDLLPESAASQAVFLELISEADSLGVYVYKVEAKDASYFTYLHDPILSQAQFSQANRASVHDLATLLKQKGMVYHQLADLFHNRGTRERTDGGRYLVLAPFIRRFYEVLESGRVDRWQESVAYVNLRGSGLADLGDFLPFDDYRNLSTFQEITQPFYYGKRSGTLPIDDRADDMIYANIIAEYLFTMTLVCGKRGYALTQNRMISAEEKRQTWQSLAQQMIDNAIYLMSVITGIDEKHIKPLVEATIDVSQYAKQMQYWMGTDYSGDLAGSDYGHIMQDLYPGAIIEQTPVFPEIKPGLGFSKDKIHQDLGAYNSQNPMKEDIKMYYFVVAMLKLFSTIATHYRESTFTFEDQLKSANYPEAQKALRIMSENSYAHSTWQKKHLLSCSARLMALWKPAGTAAASSSELPELHYTL